MGSNCTFEHDVPGIGYLESSSSSPDMKAGARPQLPVWPAEMLAVSQWLSTLSDVITHQSRSPPASGTPSRRIRGRWNYAVWRRITTGWERGFWGCSRTPGCKECVIYAFSAPFVWQNFTLNA